MALTLAAAAAGDAVVLTVAGASTTGPVALSRVDRNGTTQVRLPTGLATIGGAFTTTDYEASLAGPCRYLALDAAGATALATATLAGGSGRPQLRPTFRPQDGLTVEWVTGLSLPRQLRSSAHEVLGRPDVVYTTFGMGARTGTLTIRCTTLAKALAVVALYTEGLPLLLRLPDQAGLDMHHLGQSVDPQPQERRADGSRYWDVAVTYTEVVPSAMASLVAWTMGDAARTYPTLAAATLPHPTLGDWAANRVVL